MKKLITITFIFSVFIGIAQQEEMSTINVEISNISNDKGMLMVGLYNNKGTWLNKLFSGKTSETKNGKATATFVHIPKGTYAISVYPDENEDGKLNMFLGMVPTEDTGASNNAPGKWEDAKFEVKEKTINQFIKL